MFNNFLFDFVIGIIDHIFENREPNNKGGEEDRARRRRERDERKKRK